MTRNLIVTALVAILMAGFVLAYTALQPAQAQPAMGRMNGGTARATGNPIPPVTAYYEGQQVRFIHTEVSDPKVARTLTTMMGSPVLVVPALAQVPEAAQAKVYVFTNGVKGGGPMGFQPDIFDTVPGDPGYSPLRRLLLVTWKAPAKARELKTLREVMDAEARGEVVIEQTDVVINEPFVEWPGGHR